MVFESGTHPAQKFTIGLYAFQHFFLCHVFVHYKVPSLFVIFILRPPGAGCVHDQKRSERIRVLPYSSIALTRSCFIFFIAIPPKKVQRIHRHWNFLSQILQLQVFVCCPWDGRIIAPPAGGKKWDNWLLIGRYWLLWIKYESFADYFVDCLWTFYGYPKLFPYISLE